MARYTLPYLFSLDYPFAKNRGEGSSHFFLVPINRGAVNVPISHPEGVLYRCLNLQKCDPGANRVHQGTVDTSTVPFCENTAAYPKRYLKGWIERKLELGSSSERSRQNTQLTSPGLLFQVPRPTAGMVSPLFNAKEAMLTSMPGSNAGYCVSHFFKTSSRLDGPSIISNDEPNFGGPSDRTGQEYSQEYSIRFSHHDV
eukprot:13976-Prorocentrum_minimum.AAC.1